MPAPDPEEAIAHEHRSSAEWIRSTSDTFEDLEQQEDTRVTPEISRRVLEGMRPWKAQGCCTGLLGQVIQCASPKDMSTTR